MADGEKIRKSDATRAKIINNAIKIFSKSDFKDVSITAIAKDLDIAPQGIYRYFKDKREIFNAALAHDIESLQNQLILQMQEEALPYLTGSIWSQYSKMITQHPLAMSEISSRNPEAISLLSALDSTSNIFKLIESEISFGQENSIIRPDLNISNLVEASKYFFANVLAPLLYEDKYGGPEWINSMQVLLGSMFYPIPDVSTPEKIQEFEEKLAKLVRKLNS